VSGSTESFAERVEGKLEDLGLSLTMGGEPTFIPIEPEGPEWHNAAMGPEKLGYARRVSARLLRELYPGGLVMQVFGKQYPGEPLPRWVVLNMSRKDGVSMWSHPELFLLDDVEGPHDGSAARKLVASIATELDLRKYVLPCVELDGPADEPRGWVLPLDRKNDDWVSDRWPHSSEDPIVLTPGQSPIGLRLPLDALAPDRLRRALTVEETKGALHVFIPPLDFDAYHALIRVIERAAVARRCEALVLCGYRPSDADSVTFVGFAADPGVLEVNLPPSKTWVEYDQTLRAITDAARAEGLVTTRLHLNGEVQGTGGGAHVLFGGPTLDENPFFERPRLLSSMLRYWQRHPVLSYLFSGQYVGPGSQAPRADETLLGKLYELETACIGVDSTDDTEDRGLLDRTFRNLLTDGAGNMHLAELSIDKLWNFDSPTGLQGLVELRAFETMPRVEDQSLCALFIRGVVAMLAATPCTEPLLRHGPKLHDRFMLPAALDEDLQAVCTDLQRAGLPADRAWFEAIFETRFPIIGRLEIDAGDVVVRQALEPWPLMAEMAGGGQTSRMVDNSTDRLEVTLSNRDLLEGFRVLANGVSLRFFEIGESLAAGVRYKAAAGWPALHPHVPIQSPLSIDVIDRSGTRVAGATYHYWNPFGPRYDGAPKGFDEAEKRRMARWRPLPRDAGEAVSPVFPVYSEDSYYTLDLRRQAAVRGR
jgi:uncharacterized protein (DUF2126 family)